MSREVRQILGKISTERVEDLFEAAGAARPSLVEVGRNKRTAERFESWRRLNRAERDKIQLLCKRLDRFVGDYARESLWRACRGNPSLRELFDGSVEILELATAILLQAPRDFASADSIRQSLWRRDRRDHSRFKILRPASSRSITSDELRQLAAKIREICSSLDGVARHVQVDQFDYNANDRDEVNAIATHHFAATVESGAETRLEFQNEEFDYILSRPAKLLTVDYCPDRGVLDVAGTSVGATETRRAIAQCVADMVGGDEPPAPVELAEFNLETFSLPRTLPIDGIADLLAARVVMIGFEGPETGAGRTYEYAGSEQSIWDRMEARGVDLKNNQGDTVFCVEVELVFRGDDDKKNSFRFKITAPNKLDLGQAGEYKELIQETLLHKWGLVADDVLYSYGDDK